MQGEITGTHKMGAETDCGDWCILDRDGARITILINIRLGDAVAQDAGELLRGVGAAAQGVIIYLRDAVLLGKCRQG